MGTNWSILAVDQLR